MVKNNKNYFAANMRSIIKCLLISLIIFNNIQPQSLTGTWELIYAAPVNADDSDPKGITNIRLRFTPEGNLYSLLPEDSLTNGIEPVKFYLRNNYLVISPSTDDSASFSITFPDSATFIIKDIDTPARRFIKLPDKPSSLCPIEPKSIQLIYTGDTTNYNVCYDEADYSSLPFAEHLKGTWEVLSYENIPHSEMPPYGFLNDIWVFKDKELTVYSRIDQKNITVPYVTGSNEIIITPSGNDVQIIKVSFNKWGHLVLDSGNEIIKLKLASRETEKVPVNPLKVVLLKLTGEN